MTVYLVTYTNPDKTEIEGAFGSYIKALEFAQYEVMDDLIGEWEALPDHIWENHLNHVVVQITKVEVR